MAAVVADTVGCTEVVPEGIGTEGIGVEGIGAEGIGTEDTVAVGMVGDTGADIVAVVWAARAARRVVVRR